MENKSGKWYLTYYEEYPIYEAAEGGYYYAGCQSIEYAEYDSRDEAVNCIEKFCERYGIELIDGITKSGISTDEYINRIIEKFGDGSSSIKIAVDYSDYIGENRYVFIESGGGFESQERGYEPYC